MKRISKWLRKKSDQWRDTSRIDRAISLCRTPSDKDALEKYKSVRLTLASHLEQIAKETII